jgi:small-conductance mechanosensitive channel
MGDHGDQGDRMDGEPEESPIEAAARQAAGKANRFSREFLATVISLVTTAFGVVVALAWNEALSEALKGLSRGAQLTGLFLYAVLVTILAVFIILFLGKLAGRIGAEPIEFKYPVKPTSKE